MQIFLHKRLLLSAIHFGNERYGRPAGLDLYSCVFIVNTIPVTSVIITINMSIYAGFEQKGG